MLGRAFGKCEKRLRARGDHLLTLFLPVAMETNPRPFIPSGTGNILQRRRNGGGLDQTRQWQCRGRGRWSKIARGAGGLDGSGGTGPRDKG